MNGAMYRLTCVLAAAAGLAGCGAAPAGQSDGQSESQPEERSGQQAGGASVALEYFPSDMENAPFSNSVRAGDIIFLSGQIGLDPENLAETDVRTQTRITMDNLARNLEQAGGSMDSVVKCTVMLDDIDQWATVNEVYVEYFKPGRLPARSAFGVDGLAFGAAMEIECLALAPAAD